MTDVYGPFDTSSWAQEEWFRHMLPAMPSGVIDTPAASSTTGGLALLTSGRNVGLDQGRANVGGAGFYRTGAQTANQAVSANANATLQRRDRLVLRRSIASNTVTPTLIIGTASATPATPALTRNDTTWDLPMFSWLTPPASGTTLTSILDERRWVDPNGDVGALGTKGYGVGLLSPDQTFTSSSTSGTRPSTPIQIAVHLYPGRIYEAQHDLRCYGDTAGATGGVYTKICKFGATPSFSDANLCGSTAILTVAGSSTPYSLRGVDQFTVSAEDDYLISMWGYRAFGSGTVTFTVTPTGRMTQWVKDMGTSAAAGPSGLANINQPI